MLQQCKLLDPLHNQFFFLLVQARAGWKQHWGDLYWHCFPPAVLQRAGGSVIADVMYLSFYLL